MHPISSYQPKIPPIPPRETRPTWSIMIPTYNCTNYLRETLQSVLSQSSDEDDMHIEVVDDCSTQDDPYRLVRELADNRVLFFRQPINKGHVENFNTCLSRSKGKLIHLLHGDDFVAPEFYTKMQNLFDINPDIGAAFCRYTHINENGQTLHTAWLEQEKPGILKDWLFRIAVQQRIQPPSIVVRREVYEALGGFDRRSCCNAEDWEMWVRIASHYSIAYEPSILAHYRIQSKSLTGSSAKSGQNLRDLIEMMKIIAGYLPDERKESLLKQSKKNFAEYYLYSFIPDLIEKGDYQAVINQVREIPKLDRSSKTFMQLACIILRVAKRRIVADKSVS